MDLNNCKADVVSATAT